MSQLRVLIAASGTGGHLFPALQIAAAIRRHDPTSVIEFVGSGRPLEEKLVKGGGYPLHTLNVAGIKNRGARGIFQFLFSLPSSVIRTVRLIRSLSPRVIIGAGGYVTFSPIVLGRLFGIPTWIHEAELKPGLANYLLSFVATRVSIAHEEAVMPTSSNVVFTGHPVREGLLAIRSFAPLEAAPRRILVLGGSQGAEGLDRGMTHLAFFLKEKGVELFHQARPVNVPWVEECYRANGVSARVVPFIEEMDAAYAWSDIIVSRSGAGSTMEIGVVNRPVLFVPFPHSQGDHQAKNAMTLVARGKALMEREGEGFFERLKLALEQLLDKEFYNAMRSRPCENRSVEAADLIARGVVDLALFRR